MWVGLFGGHSRFLIFIVEMRTSAVFFLKPPQAPPPTHRTGKDSKLDCVCVCECEFCLYVWPNTYTKMMNDFMVCLT